MALESHMSKDGGRHAHDQTLQSLWERFSQVKANTQINEELISELLHRYSHLSEKHREISFDLQRENNYNRKAQQDIMDLNADKLHLLDEIRILKQEREQDGFILLLIDGDGMIFQDELLQQGEVGGQKAAARLHTVINELLQQEFPTIPSNTKIIARVYANFKGLATICHKAGVIPSPTLLSDFARGFTRARSLFDFVDVGSGKDRADGKISELFKHHLYDYRCRQILFGCSHDNGYARLLEELTMDERAIKNITLLEGVPFERELASLPFKTKKFETIFRQTKINISQNGNQDKTPPQKTEELFMGSMPVMPTNTFSSSKSSWVSAVQKPTKSPHESPVISTASLAPATGGTVPRNRYGQRIDPPLRPYIKEEIYRIKKMKLCNIHYLRHECYFGKDCTHEHEYKPSTTDIQILKHVARLMPCTKGLHCDDPKCVYGHRCQAPAAPGSSGTGRNCIHGEACRFTDEQHNLDTKVVKTVKV